ncbi:hypothetical protein BV25DRAFT_1818709 [Artomyces pyxidatus]|uniref:Uncharacterized protein n=1 Tax=Artomyces pyxidatus TaxID=48021 RepID=A0ACB8TIQ0_9AGAM|nr:hypothetical protein BV25DRAFT_1818709 [Artomyces pyxidatus]
MVRGGHGRKPRLRFQHPENFSRVNRGDQWYCISCTPAHRASLESMNMKEAVKHEHTFDHLRNVGVRDPWQSPPDGDAWALEPSRATVFDDMKVREHQTWVDMSPDLVSFWRRGMEAAERGEQIERMHEFLESLENRPKDAWGATGVEAWGSPAGDWGWGAGVGDSWADKDWASQPKRGGWHLSGKSDGVQGRGSSGVASRHRERDSNPAAADALVEDFVRRQSIDSRRKEKMRMFLEMPTEKKIDKIQEMIRDLHAR